MRRLNGIPLPQPNLVCPAGIWTTSSRHLSIRSLFYLLVYQNATWQKNIAVCLTFFCRVVTYRRAFKTDRLSMESSIAIQLNTPSRLKQMVVVHNLICYIERSWHAINYTPVLIACLFRVGRQLFRDYVVSVSRDIVVGELDRCACSLAQLLSRAVVRPAIYTHLSDISRYRPT